MYCSPFLWCAINHTLFYHIRLTRPWLIITISYWDAVSNPVMKTVRIIIINSHIVVRSHSSMSSIYIWFHLLFFSKYSLSFLNKEHAKSDFRHTLKVKIKKNFPVYTKTVIYFYRYINLFNIWQSYTTSMWLRKKATQPSPPLVLFAKINGKNTVF